ncbi:MAG: hypothetical protein JW866_06270 [Ignavibacteriales bacterium]|nr:hypothetical protein [Ignavibacteriales bacterium]
MNEPWYIKEALNYRKNRYMDHLSKDDLFIRAKDILINCIEINKDGKISADLSDDYGQFFWVRWTHIIEEYKLRYGSFRPMFDGQNSEGLNIPKNFPLINRANAKINNVKKNSNPTLYKYGDLKYLKQYLKNGNIRISPASSYKDPSLNHAMNDDELNFISQNHPSKLKMEVFDKFGNSKGFAKPIEGKLTFTSTTDYYVFCVSTVLSPRLFVDFNNANGCLIIKNTTIFLKKLLEDFLDNNKNYFGEIGEVKYVDPIFANYKEYDQFYSKHFRYAYQRELRICFIPDKDIKQLEKKELQLGNLEDCCELIEIEET